MKPLRLARFALPASLAATAACGGASPAPLAPTTAQAAAIPTTPVTVVTAAPDVELRDPGGKSALVGGHVVAMDGVAEGLAWPALSAAVGRKPGDHAPLTLSVARDVPTGTVLRAVWTLRDADLRLQTADVAGTLRVLELAPRPDAAPASGGCHLAVFVAATGDLRVASSGGPRTITGPDAPASLARALSTERTRCAVRYVAFGAQSPDAPWSAVFDVAEAVDREKAAGDARYVLGEPITAAPR